MRTRILDKFLEKRKDKCKDFKELVLRLAISLKPCKRALPKASFQYFLHPSLKKCFVKA